MMKITMSIIKKKGVECMNNLKRANTIIIFLIVFVTIFTSCKKTELIEKTENNTTENVINTVEETTLVNSNYYGNIKDSRLIGGWNCVSLDNKGDYTGGLFHAYDAELYIMHNGYAYGNLFSELYNLDKSGDWLNPDCFMVISGESIVFKDILYNGDFVLDIKAEYKIIDIEKSSVTEQENINKIHKEISDDQLTIHFTGSLKVGPTDVRNIDFTLVYEKDVSSNFKNEGILWAMMIGEWSDNFGNKWVFMPRNESKDLGFTVITDGKEYKGQSEEYAAISIGLFSNSEGDVAYLMDFNYQDKEMNDINRAKIISFNDQEINLELKNGDALILKNNRLVY